MSNGFASSLTDAGLRPRRSSTWRRVGSASARNTPSMECISIWSARGGKIAAPVRCPEHLGIFLSICKRVFGSTRVCDWSVIDRQKVSRGDC